MPALLLLVTFGWLVGAVSPASARAHGEDGVDQIRRFDPLATTWTMDAWANATLGRMTHPGKSLKRLEKALFGAGGLAMTESLDRTPSAAEAWRDRRANCLGLAVLTVGIGRSAGLDMVIVEELTDAELEDRSGVRVAHRHVAAAWPEAGGFWILDFAGLAWRADDRVRKLTDHQARGLYYANRGAEALLANQPTRAVPWLEAAVELAEADWVWRNLALALVRSGRPAAAAAARARARALSGSPSSR